MTPRPNAVPDRRSSARASHPHSALATASGEPVTLVHLAAEYYPYARAGGLAEAVANLARFQSRQGIRTIAIMPLHRSARERAGGLEAVGEPIPVELGPRRETVRLLTERQPPPGNRVFFIEHDGFFDRPRLYGDERGDYGDNHVRFACFALASVLALPRVAPGPAILHAHDWHAALALAYLRVAFDHDQRYARVGTVLSVHNAGYQGHYPPSAMTDLGLPWELYNWRQLEWYGKVNLLKAGLVFADQVVTVSPNHARELQTPEGGFGLQQVFAALGRRFSGILNGIDLDEWNPATDPDLAAPFTDQDLSGKARCKLALQTRFGLRPDSRLPVFGMAARLVTQKGLDIVLGDGSLFALPAQFVFIGRGEPRFEGALRAIARELPDRVAVDTNFTDELEHALMGGADFLLMPCQYEPCGLTQMRAQRYGLAPIVRRVGGLVDTVEDGVTGFVFGPFATEALVGASLRGLDCYANPPERRRMVSAAMGRDFGWNRSVASYTWVYRQVLAERSGSWT
jgi:starch synthase